MLHERACAIGISNQIYTFNNASHVPYFYNAAYMDSTERFVRDFLIDILGCTQTVLLAPNEMQEQANLYPTTYCDGSASDEICSGVGINEMTSVETLKCYPNPTSDQLTLQTNNGFELLRIYSISGELIFEASAQHSPSFELTLIAQNNGLYLIEVQFQNGQLLRNKLILKK